MTELDNGLPQLVNYDTILIKYYKLVTKFDQNKHK
jgi:hypothetical protein